MVISKGAKEAARDLREFKVQGANQIAVYALTFLKKHVEKNGFDQDFYKIAEILENARPTAAVLHNCLERIRKEKNVESIEYLLHYLKNVHDKKINLKTLFKGKSTIMTYCHSGEAMAIIKKLAMQKNSVLVYACITEPLEQGLKTAYELKKSKISVVLIGDNAAGLFMGNVDAVVVGADALRKQGLVNKIGTSLISVSAKEHKKPFYVVANQLKLDKRRQFKIEERPASEIYDKLKSKTQAKGIKIRNPAFDITPWKFVTKIITETHLLTPKQVLGRLKK